MRAKKTNILQLKQQKMCHENQSIYHRSIFGCDAQHGSYLMIKKSSILGFVLVMLASTCSAADSVSLELATGNKTEIARVGAQWNWNKSWYSGNGTHIGGYWDLTLAQWHGNQYQDIAGASQNISDLGITPVFRFQRDDKKGLYAEVGIGAHLLSSPYNNNGRRLSTHFQFGDHFGIGYVLENKVDLGMKLQHFSNAGYEEPNDGVNFVVFKVSYAY